MKLNKTQVIVIAGSIVLIVLLFFANTKIPPKTVMADSERGAADEAKPKQNLFDQTLEKLSPELRKKFDSDQKLIDVSNKNSNVFDSVVFGWDNLSQPIISAYFKEKEAEIFPSEKNLKETADRYYALTNLLKDEERISLVGKAIIYFEKTLELNPSNTDAKIDLASCYVENGENPMKGIGMLRELEKTDSNNVKLQLNLAYFSVRSGQLDKAVKRFEKVLKLKPDYYEIYLHLADIYEQKGDKQMAIKNLEKFVAATDDLTLKTEVKGYIDKLNNN